MVTEISRVGRSLMKVMHCLHMLIEREVMVYTIKAGHTLGNNLNPQALAFACSLSAEIERAMISYRTEEAVVRKWSAGKRVGQPSACQLTELD